LQRDEGLGYIDIKYKDGARDATQRWYYHSPEGINVDEREWPPLLRDCGR